MSNTGSLNLMKSNVCNIVNYSIILIRPSKKIFLFLVTLTFFLWPVGCFFLFFFFTKIFFTHYFSVVTGFTKTFCPSLVILSDKASSSDILSFRQSFSLEMAGNYDYFAAHFV